MSMPITSPAASPSFNSSAASQSSSNTNDPASLGDKQIADASALSGTQSAGLNQGASLADFSAANHSVDSLSQLKGQSPAQNRDAVQFTIPYSGPKPAAGSVTPGVSANGQQLTNTINVGDPAQVSAVTSRTIGEAARVTSVTATARPADGITATVGVRPAAGTTPAQVNAGVTATTPIGNGNSVTGGVSQSQPLGGARGTTTITGSLQGTGANAFQVSASAFSGANPGFGVSVRAPIGNSASVTFAGTNRQTENSSSVTARYDITPGLNANISNTQNGLTGENRTRIGIGGSW